MNKSLIILGVLCLLIGLTWPWLKNLPLGRLPGDITIVRENFRFYFPITSSLVISVILSILIWLFKR